jgi:hypothetical protein
MSHLKILVDNNEKSKFIYMFFIKKKQKKYYDKIVEIPKVHHMVNIKIK